MDDIKIIDLYFARDEQAIKETDIKYGKLCLGLANNILHCYEDSEECVNDTYFSVWNSVPPTRPGNFRAYLCRIVRNISLKKLDYSLAEKRSRDLTVSLSELEEILPDKRVPSEPGAEELGGIINEFLRREKEEARNVFIRKYYFFDTIEDIAARYEFSVSKVKNMLCRSRKRLKEYLKKEGIEV